MVMEFDRQAVFYESQFRQTVRRRRERETYLMLLVTRRALHVQFLLLLLEQV